MHWVLQENLFEEAGWNELIEQLERTHRVRYDCTYSVHKVVPFSGELEPPFTGNKYNSNTSNVICFGSYSLRHTAKKMGWNPGVFNLDHATFPVQREAWETICSMQIVR